MEETENGSAILSAFDLNASGLLDQLAAAGVSAFKIEGRMKSEFYIAGAVNAYRMALDGTADRAAVEAELAAISHRPYCTGFYEGPVHGQAWDGAYLGDCRYVGLVTGDADAEGFCTVQAKNRIFVGDTLELLSPGRPGQPFVVTALLDEAGLREQVLESLLAAIQKHLDRRVGDKLRVGAVLFSNEYGLLGQTETAKIIMEQWRKL